MIIFGYFVSKGTGLITWRLNIILFLHTDPESRSLQGFFLMKVIIIYN